MGILLPFVFILAGLLAAGSVIVQKAPSMKDSLDKLNAYQAYIGLGAFVIGLLAIFDTFSKLSGSVMVASLAGCLSSMAVGFLMGYPIIQKMILDDMSDSARKKSEEIRGKIAPFQVVFGLVAIGAGVYVFLFGFLFAGIRH